MFGRRAFLPIHIELNTKDPNLLIKEYCSSKEDNTNIVRLITQQPLEKLKAANYIVKEQEKQKDTYDKKHAKLNAFIKF